MTRDNKMGAAVIGFGYWGPNLARNISGSNVLRLDYICDLSAKNRSMAASEYQGTKVTGSLEEILSDSSVGAIFIATPPSTHFSLALKSLDAGKHVLVEKPLANSSKECRILIEKAENRGCTLMVDHTFAYTGAVRKMKALAASSLGVLQYYDSVRINLGLFQRDVNVLWDLAVHDLAILDNITSLKPVAISATGHAHVEGYPANSAYLTLFYEESFIAHIHCSWMAPVKIRRTLLGGSEKMVVYDDLEPTEKIKVYDKGISLNPSSKEKYDLRVDYRTADILSPKVDGREALASMIEEFANAIRTNSKPLTDAMSGMRIVAILESADISLSKRGAPIDIPII